MGVTVGRERLAVNHLFFADDCILFGDASCEGARVVRDIIREYEMASGQRVNFDKSFIYFGANVSSNVEDIINLLGVRMATNPEKYLGLPMMVGRRKTWLLLIFLIDSKKELMGGVCAFCQWGVKRFSLNRSCRQPNIMQCNVFFCQKSYVTSLKGL